MVSLPRNVKGAPWGLTCHPLLPALLMGLAIRELGVAGRRWATPSSRIAPSGPQPNSAAHTSFARPSARLSNRLSPGRNKEPEAASPGSLAATRRPTAGPTRQAAAAPDCARPSVPRPSNSNGAPQVPRCWARAPISRATRHELTEKDPRSRVLPWCPKRLSVCTLRTSTPSTIWGTCTHGFAADGAVWGYEHPRGAVMFQEKFDQSRSHPRYPEAGEAADTGGEDEHAEDQG
ncbi:hypothetical protein MAPG_08843 [Magnaporthiopsis poae ATCC 64411]|uniref:Uncharacterized protein n=1 Tax=Magnaporthiopsis poae (strain ATCC 64411 / 73-15) TaxID=644358 RepID=A0A0C4E8E2_MAGP6|nr:hypothetical protein MAPG_08843 [Magnaporthiopsis poae ATCC 64411]